MLFGDLGQQSGKTGRVQIGQFLHEKDYLKANIKSPKLVNAPQGRLPHKHRPQGLPSLQKAPLRGPSKDSIQIWDADGNETV